MVLSSSTIKDGPPSPLEKANGEINQNFMRTHTVRPYGDGKIFFAIIIRFDSSMAIIYISKLQIFDKGENRYVLFGTTKQHNLREILSRSWLKSFFGYFFLEKSIILPN